MEITINPGRLSSISSMHKSFAPSLAKLRTAILDGFDVNLTWDLTSAIPGSQNLLCLATLLSVAKSVREHTGKPGKLIIENTPDLINFWRNSRFFYYSLKFDLFENEILSENALLVEKSYSAKIVFFQAPKTIPEQNDRESFNAWKDRTRPLLARDIWGQCRTVFGKNNLPDYLKDGVSLSIGELVVNAFVHGKSPAFIGLQSSPSRVSLSVSDSGVGFLASVKGKLNTERHPAVFSDVDALATACFMNRHEVGLLRAVDLTLSHNGRVRLSSNFGEISWSQERWRLAKSQLGISSTELYFDKINATSYAGLEAQEFLPEADHDEYPDSAFYRTWPNLIRGARVEISIPTK